MRKENEKGGGEIDEGEELSLSLRNSKTEELPKCKTPTNQIPVNVNKMDLTTRRITDPKPPVKHFKSTVTVGASHREEDGKEILEIAKQPGNMTNDALS